MRRDDAETVPLGRVLVVSPGHLDALTADAVATSEKGWAMQQLVQTDAGITSSRPRQNDFLGWVATCGGVLVLLAGSVPLLGIALSLAGVIVALSVFMIARGPASARNLAGHGLAGLVTSLVGVAVALTLTASPVGTLYSLGRGPDSEEAPPPVAKGKGSTDTGESPVALQPAEVRASSSAGPSHDSSGHLVTFKASNVIDGDATTAWRVGGRGVGETLTFTFRRSVHLTAVGMIPGYAKVDNTSGLNRFLQNRRVTKARYSFTNGWHVEVRFSDEPTMQSVDLDVDTTFVEVRILSTSSKTERNFTAISEVTFEGWVTG